MDELYGDLQQLRDPSRRWLRRTYQEGPGFRFLATRGGRPPGSDAPRRDLAVVRERALVVRTMREEGLVAALALGRCSRRSVFRYQSAYERGGKRQGGWERWEMVERYSHAIPVRDRRSLPNPLAPSQRTAFGQLPSARVSRLSVVG